MEPILDFRVEAEKSLKEVAYAIQEGELSQCLASSSSCAYINLTTKEGKKLTIRLSMRGFEVGSNFGVFTSESSVVCTIIMRRARGSKSRETTLS